jgi:predicted transcriptional regulator
METLWSRGVCSIRELQEAFPEKSRPAFTTVQTMVYRLEVKKALRCVKRIGKANIFEAVITRKSAQGRLIDELLSLFGGKPVMAHMVKAGHLTLEDIKEAEQELRRMAEKGKTR